MWRILRRFIRRLYGSVVLEVISPKPEGFANICISNGIKLKKVRRSGEGRLELSMRAEDFFRLPGLIAGGGFRVHILKKTGFSRKLLPLLKRPGLIIGFAMAYAMLAILSSFVWSVSISHNGSNDRELLQKLREYGLYTGAYIKDLDQGLLKEQMILALEDISWVGIFVRGSSVKITYELKTPAPEIIPLDEPCSIYATKTGILTKLNVFKGFPAAAVGTTVKKGDLLVSSAVPIGETDFMYAHAMAQVEARTWYEMEALALTAVQKKTYTGRQYTKTYIYLGNKHINLGLGYRNIFDKYDIITSVKSFGGGMPFSVVTETYVEYETQEAVLDGGAETERLKAFLGQTLEAGLAGGEMIASRYTVSAENGTAQAKIYCECREDIGVTVKDTSLPEP